MIIKYLIGRYVFNNLNRDIKPENFMLNKLNDIQDIKLIDFGLSKDYSGAEVMATPSGSVISIH